MPRLRKKANGLRVKCRHILYVVMLILIAIDVVAARRSTRIPQAFFDPDVWDSDRSTRKTIIKDLVTNVVPKKNRTEIEQLLGESPSYEEWRRHSVKDYYHRRLNKAGEYESYPRTGKGHYYDEYNWDLIYPIGKERILIYDHRGIEFSPDEEYLILRLNTEGTFESWYIVGSHQWSNMVGEPGNRQFKMK